MPILNTKPAPGYSHGTMWTTELVTSEIKSVMNAIGIDRMPTNSECQRITGSAGLSCKISKTGGFAKWAKRLDLKSYGCETMMGKAWEDVAEETISAMGYGVSRMPVRHPFDLLVGSFVRIDVKVSKLYRGPSGDFWTFNLEKNPGTCDIYVCYCINDDETVNKILIVPAAKAKVTQLSVGHNSRYETYKNRWDYIDTFNEFHAKLMSN